MVQRSTSSIYRFGGFVFDRFMTHSPPMVECLRLAKAAAATPDLSVLVTGETGTGKNLLAQAIHNASPRADKPCVVVNCTALSETLMESELFGHEKGAFTGAEKLHKGRFELANGGTLILDEIGDMSGSAQAKILRAVEYGQFERLGGQQTLQVDVRVIALTNRPLDRFVVDGRFRQDLLFRLREFHVQVPPLRERPEDIELLAQIFVNECVRKYGKRIQGLTPEALRLLCAHAWPGNLRELRSVIRRAGALVEEGRITAHDLGLDVAAADPVPAMDPVPGYTLKDAERAQIERVLRHTNGNKRQASRLLEIARNTLDKKIAEYGLDLSVWRRAGLPSASEPDPDGAGNPQASSVDSPANPADIPDI